MTKKEWKRRRLKLRIAKISAVLIILGLIAGAVYLAYSELKKSTTGGFYASLSDGEDELTLSVNGVTRTGEKTALVGTISLNDCGYKNLTALELRNRYERADILNPLLADPLEKGAHYAVGIDGSIIEMVPLTEKVPGSEGNIVIVYSPDNNGNLTSDEEKAINKLLEELCEDYSISENNIIRN